MTVELSQAVIGDANGALEARLGDIARTPADSSCRYKIWAHSDAQGRRIYQALSTGTSGPRPRAQILMRSPAGVERTCFGAD